MLSGLMRAKELHLDHLDVTSYYHKRLSHLLYPFYLSYLLVLICRIATGTAQFSAPRRRIILTVLGIDGYVADLFPQHRIATFYLVGEWFFGAMLLVTLSWPVLRMLMHKHLIATLLTALALECLLPYFFMSIGQYPTVTRLPTTCIGTFALGVTIGFMKRTQDARDANSGQSARYGECWEYGRYGRYGRYGKYGQCAQSAQYVYVVIGIALIALSFLFPANPILNILRKQTLVAGVILVITFMTYPQSIRKPSWLSDPSTCFSGRLVARAANLSIYVFLFQHVVIKFILRAAGSSLNQAYGISGMLGIVAYYALMAAAVGLSFLLAFLANQLERKLRNTIPALHAA